MPLARRLIFINLSLLAALAVLGAALAWSVYDMRHAVSSAADEYTELQLVEQAMYHCALAKSELSDPDSGSADAAGELRIAIDALQRFREFQAEEEEADDEHQSRELMSAAEADRILREVLAAIEPMNERGGVDLQHMLALDAALHHFSELAADTDVAGAKAASAERTVTTLVVVAVLAALIALGSMLASAVCYWSVINPLKRLHTGVRRVAAGAFNERLDEAGSREFADLAGDFNHMAAELANLYANLESKVQAKSQELVRSERLASVGFLAAGVAHEINNPLNIMSGYAEMAQGWLDDAKRNGRLHEVQEALEIIRQEAFRCKEITGKLLSLASAGEAERGNVSLPRLANDVVQMVGGLRKFRDRTISVHADDDAAQPVRGSAAELKQVLLNLLVNALEAAPTVGGEVRIECRRAGSNVEVIVSDNGLGMSPDVLAHIFEPFFTTRRGGAPSQRTRGVGLGLSISHAIIASHGGRLRAESEGPQRGSRFIIELPVAREIVQEPSNHAVSLA